MAGRSAGTAIELEPLQVLELPIGDVSKEQRSRSQMAAVLIEEALRARGFLPAQDSED